MALHEVRKTKEKDAVFKSDPFGAFLAARRPQPISKSGVVAQLGRQDADPVLLDVGKACREVAHSGYGLPLSPAGDHFSTFLAIGASRPQPATTTVVEQGLREEVLRAKRQLLQLTMQSELHALDPNLPEAEVAKTLRKLRKAQDYLRDPSRIEDVSSASESGESADEDVARVRSQSSKVDTSVPESPSPNTSPLSVPRSPSKGMSSTKMSSGSTSLPNLRAEVTILPAISDTAKPGASLSLPAISDNSRPSASPSTNVDEQVLSCWWAKTRSWNIYIRDCKARRQNLGLPGGTVLFGNDRVPSFASSNGLATVYFYSFRIDAVDDEHFPLDGVKDMSLVLGVSQYNARHRSCQRPMYAYEVPDSVLIGYGGNLIDKGKWTKTPWDARTLKVGDIVGLLIAEDGDLVIFVNKAQVLRVHTSLNESGQKSKRVLFPLLDLHGRICAVTLLPRQSPPEVPLGARTELKFT
mmetsp:Transcript_49036/g.76509  ORF Transcript_49036/g.76509 Transcript_49036/m.76509 type:complete len:468 (-) Transcript_49036:79-1482(-)